MLEGKENEIEGDVGRRGVVDWFGVQIFALVVWNISDYEIGQN